MDVTQLKRRTGRKFRFVEVLMDDSVSPPGELFQQPLSPGIARLRAANGRPEVKAEASKVGTQIRRIRITAVKLAPFKQSRTRNNPNRVWENAGHNLFCRLRMELATESLELRRQENRICMVQLGS